MSSELDQLLHNIMQKSFGLAIVVGGIYLVTHSHAVAGGWTIFGGILIMLNSWTNDSDKKGSR